MKKYHVYGIGNALVDMEIEVTDDFLNEMGIDKGVMTLVEENRQDELMSSLVEHHHERACGGSAANTIIAVNNFGGNAFYSCKVANDEIGDFYIDDLHSSGVVTNHNAEVSREQGVTGKCLVMVTPDAERTMNTFLGITDKISVTELVPSEIESSEYLYIEGYLVSSDIARAAAIEAKNIAEKSGVKTALTFSDPAMVQFFKDGLKEMLGDNGVDLLFCNDAEAMAFTDCNNLPDAFEALKSVSKTFAVTTGADGAVVCDGDRLIEIAPNLVKPIDTNGAGDMFAGAFLYGITHGMDFSKAGEFASLASSRVVCHFGPRLNTLDYQDLLHDFLS